MDLSSLLAFCMVMLDNMEDKIRKTKENKKPRKNGSFEKFVFVHEYEILFSKKSVYFWK